MLKIILILIISKILIVINILIDKRILLASLSHTHIVDRRNAWAIGHVTAIAC